ncbi:MAG: aldehyde:ferredoxin oxidoreductase, partial [Deltaproteobacteria bacterium]
VKEIASRTLNVERAFNAREGLNEKDDVLPERLMTEPLPSGPNKNQIITQEEFQLMKREFYEAAKWDLTTGLPTRSTLEALGLKEVADQLAL